MPGRGLIILIGVPAFWLHLAIGVYLFLSYPTGRVTGRVERVVVVICFLISGTGSVLLLLLVRRLQRRFVLIGAARARCS